MISKHISGIFFQKDKSLKFITHNHLCINQTDEGVKKITYIEDITRWREDIDKKTSIK